MRPISVKNAYEVREQYGKDGKCIKRERIIGPIVVWAIVVLIAMAAGQLTYVPFQSWHLFK